MTINKATQTLHNRIVSSRLFQIIIISAFWLLGEAIVRIAHLPFPGAVAGLALVLILLASGKIKPTSMRGGAQWLLADMLLFFVPAVLAVLDHQEFLGIVGLKILAVILGGTAAVMCSTALAVDFGYRMMMRLEQRHVPV
ncbi:CidA/LrgA family protein [Agrobacterium sp. NPDC090273]|uniref:CidA/LrgA family protein n=1 Tax=Agrobacterium sp. NPDC090273 TaxID=3363919 RepID=UPI00383A9947